MDPGLVQGILRQHAVPVSVLPGQMYNAVGMSDVAMVASGTATLETALLQTPMVITYKISPLTAAVGKRLIRVQHIGLVNIIAGKALVPELVQDDATAEKLAAEVKGDPFRPAALRCHPGSSLGSGRNWANLAPRRAAELALGLKTTGDEGRKVWGPGWKGKKIYLK